MAKRFIDTKLFDDNWFSELSRDAKIAWLYLLTKCDYAGIFEISFKLSEFQTGIKCFDTVITELGQRVINLKNGKYFIPKFIYFQYSKGLNENHSVHRAIIKRLNEFSLYNKENNTVLSECFQCDNTVQDKDIVKDKNIDIFNEKQNFLKSVKNKNFIPPTKDQVINYLNTEKNITGHAAETITDNFIDFYSSKGWKVGKNSMKDWQAALRLSLKWEKNIDAINNTGSSRVPDFSKSITDLANEIIEKRNK